ncbi:MAG: Rrf2 family transcriptional regulator [Clostridiales bacterium]|nr:Rrf2 family transcriptional regulator [Candidatus Blautia equi]
MFITRECDYAVRVVRALKNGKKLSVTEICEREEITAPFAYKILKKLQKAGIVTGFRGAKGGYTLKKPLKELDLLTIYMAIDTDLFLNDCLEPGYSCSRNEGDEMCNIHHELGEVQAELYRLLKRKNLAELFYTE